MFGGLRTGLSNRRGTERCWRIWIGRQIQCRDWIRGGRRGRRRRLVLLRRRRRLGPRRCQQHGDSQHQGSRQRPRRAYVAQCHRWKNGLPHIAFDLSLHRRPMPAGLAHPHHSSRLIRAQVAVRFGLRQSRDRSPRVCAPAWALPGETWRGGHASTPARASPCRVELVLECRSLRHRPWCGPRHPPFHAK